MLHLSPILSAWSPSDWGQFLGYLATFLTLALLPFLIKIFSALKELRDKNAATDTKATEAVTKADAAVTSIKNTNDRAFNAALATPTLVVPVVVPAADKPATEKTLNDVKTAVQDLPHSDKPPMQVRT